MDYSTEVTYNVNQKLWDSNLAKNQASTTYQCFAWVFVRAKNTKGSKPVYIIVRDNKGNIVGQLAIFLRLTTHTSNKLRGLLSSKLNFRTMEWNYGPIIHDEKNKDRILQEILSAVDSISKANNVISVRGISPPLSFSLNSKLFLKYDYKVKPWATYITSFYQSPEEFNQSLDKKIRYDIRTGEKNKLEFEIANDRKTASEFNKLKRKSRGQISDLESVTFDYRHWVHLYQKNLEKVFLVKQDGIVIGGIFCLVFNGNMIQHGVVNAQTKNLQGGSFLLWNILRWGMTEKNKTFDVAGINPNPVNNKEKKIAHFKAKWNGEKKEYFIYSKTFSQTKSKIHSLLAK